MFGDRLKVVRTRDPIRADIVYDVGCLYAPEKCAFDHHQEGGAGRRYSGVPYSSAGLLWLEMGFRVIRKVLAKIGVDPTSNEVSDIWWPIDRVLITEIDACDNNWYRRRSGFSISDAVSAYNPTGRPTARDFDACYLEAVQMMTRVLTGKICHQWDVLAAKPIVNNAERIDGNIVVLPWHVPWQQHVTPTDRYVIFPDEETRSWKVMPTGDNGTKLLFPPAWASATRARLKQLTGVPDAGFCHEHRFIAGAGSREGAIALAKLSLEQRKPSSGGAPSADRMLSTD